MPDHHSKTNIDSLLEQKAALANPSFVGTVPTPNLTVAMDATMDGNLFVAGTDKIIRVGKIDAPPSNNSEPGGIVNVGLCMNSTGSATLGETILTGAFSLGLPT